MRAAQPLHPPTFLVYQNRRIPPEGCAQVGTKCAQLIGGFDISAKKNKTPRIDLGEKSFFVGC